jgi:hypothetical protein
MAGAYGTTPSQIGLPQSVYQEAQTAVPELAGLTAGAGGIIQGQIGGRLNPDVINNIKDQAAAWGISSGLPGSDIQGNFSLKDLGLSSMQEQQTGVGNYLNFMGAIGQQQLDPGLVSSISQWNSLMASAPDPQAAAMEQQKQQREAMLYAANPWMAQAMALDPSGALMRSVQRGAGTAYTGLGGGGYRAGYGWGA